MAKDQHSPLILLFSNGVEKVFGFLNEAIAERGRLTVETKQLSAKTPFVALWDGLELDCNLLDAPENLVVQNSVFTNSPTSAFKFALSVSLGEKLRGGNRVAPIWSGLLEAGAYLAEKLGAECVYWSPSANLIEAGYFKDSIHSFVEGAAFPALTLVRFDTGEGDVIRSTGLEWFSGQEIVAVHPSLSTREAMYRLVRIAHDMAMVGPYTNDTELGGLIEGERLLINPDDQGGQVHIQITSKTDALLH